MPLRWTDHRADPGAWAAALGVSPRACELLLDADLFDLHLDLEVSVRLLGIDPTVRHPPRARPAVWFGHTDWPRLREAGFTGVAYDIATNPLRGERARQQALLANLARVAARAEAHADEVVIARTHGEYVAARASGRLALMPTVQGGNALAHDPDALDGEPGRTLHRITLVHLTSSVIGGTSSPLGRDRGLTERGRQLMAACHRNRVLVDLAHAGRRTFWDAIEAHDPGLPPIVSHTGLAAVRPHWRNLDDAQVRAIADRGGVIGVMYQSNFLAPVWGYARRADVVAHLAHVVNVAGEGAVAIGTDYDGMIVPPRDLPDVTAHPLLVQDLLDLGWSEGLIRRALGENYLRVLRGVRP